MPINKININYNKPSYSYIMLLNIRLMIYYLKIDNSCIEFKELQVEK